MPFMMRAARSRAPRRQMPYRVLHDKMCAVTRDDPCRQGAQRPANGPVVPCGASQPTCYEGVAHDTSPWLEHVVIAVPGRIAARGSRPIPECAGTSTHAPLAPRSARGPDRLSARSLLGGGETAAIGVRPSAWLPIHIDDRRCMWFPVLPPDDRPGTHRDDGETRPVRRICPQAAARRMAPGTGFAHVAGGDSATGPARRRQRPTLAAHYRIRESQPPAGQRLQLTEDPT